MSKDNGRITHKIFPVGDGWIKLTPVSLVAYERVQAEAVEDMEAPKAPARLSKAETTFGGKPQLIEYTSLEDLSGLEEDEDYEDWVEALLEYQEALGKYNTVITDATTRFMYIRGVHPCTEDGENIDAKTMRARLKSIGLKSPKDEYDLKRKYIECWAIGNATDDLVFIGVELMRISAPQEAEVQRRLDGFLADNERAIAEQLTAEFADAGDNEQPGVSDS